MNWVLSKQGGWVEEKERKRRNSVPQLPDEIVLFIYKLSQGLLMRDIKMRGTHCLFKNMICYDLSVHQCLSQFHGVGTRNNFKGKITNNQKRKVIHLLDYPKSKTDKIKSIIHFYEIIITTVYI
jgi:hypothetical protein